MGYSVHIITFNTVIRYCKVLVVVTVRFKTFQVIQIKLNK